MSREMPATKQVTMWTGAGRSFRRRSDAYYAIAKAMVMARYPRWLCDGTRWRPDADASDPKWDARRDRAMELFFDGEYFDSEKWRRLIKRVARFLAFVDRKRATS